MRCMVASRGHAGESGRAAGCPAMRRGARVAQIGRWPTGRRPAPGPGRGRCRSPGSNQRQSQTQDLRRGGASQSSRHSRPLPGVRNQLLRLASRPRAPRTRHWPLGVQSRAQRPLRAAPRPCQTPSQAESSLWRPGSHRHRGPPPPPLKRPPLQSEDRHCPRHCQDVNQELPEPAASLGTPLHPPRACQLKLNGCRARQTTAQTLPGLASPPPCRAWVLARLPTSRGFLPDQTSFPRRQLQ